MSERSELVSRHFLTLEGQGVSVGVAAGPLLRLDRNLLPRAAEGAILVGERAAPDDVGLILASSGTVTLAGAILSHVSLLSREFAKPSVSLNPASRVRLLPAGGFGLLVLGDVVGGEGPPILEEGDVVLLDGSLGTLTVPGGVDPRLRGGMRAVHAALLGLAGDPEDPRAATRAAERAASEGPAAVLFALEAGIVHGVVPPGEPSRRLVEGLARHPSAGPVLRAWLSDAAARIGSAARRRADGAREALLAAGDPADVRSIVRSTVAAAARDREILSTLSADGGAVDAAVEAVVAAASEQEGAIRTRLGEDLGEALSLPQAAIRARVGGLLHLVRRARSAGLAEETFARLERRLQEEVAEQRSRAGGRLVVPLEEGAPADPWLIGGKAAGLLCAAPALPAGSAIPPGFVVTTVAYRLHLVGERAERLREALEQARDEAEASRRARAVILSGPLLDEVARAIARAAAPHAGEGLAVRSSATVEDGPSSRLAGVFDTVLGVRGEAEIVERVRHAWASLWNARALRAMAALGLSPLEASQAVLVQRVVETRAAGVMLARDPSGRRDTILVNASWGLGEAISQGEVPGDLFWVRRSTGEVLASETSEAGIRVVLDPDRPGTVEERLPPELASRPSLSPEDLSRLAELSRALESASGRPHDVEFGFDGGGTLMVFQVRAAGPPSLP